MLPQASVEAMPHYEPSRPEFPSVPCPPLLTASGHMLVAAAVPHRNNGSGHSDQQRPHTSQEGKARTWFRRQLAATFRSRQSAAATRRTQVSALTRKLLPVRYRHRRRTIVEAQLAARDARSSSSSGLGYRVRRKCHQIVCTTRATATATAMTRIELQVATTVKSGPRASVARRMEVS